MPYYDNKDIPLHREFSLSQDSCVCEMLFAPEGSTSRTNQDTAWRSWQGMVVNTTSDQKIYTI